jgi:hypothetical protein
MGPYPGGGTEFAPATAQNHTFTLLLGADCGVGSGITATSAALDVIGTK